MEEREQKVAFSVHQGPYRPVKPVGLQGRVERTEPALYPLQPGGIEAQRQSLQGGKPDVGSGYLSVRSEFPELFLDAADDLGGGGVELAPGLGECHRVGRTVD